MKLDRMNALLNTFYIVAVVLFFAHKYRASLVASYASDAIGMVILCRASLHRHGIRIDSR